MRRILRKIAANEHGQLGDTTTLAFSGRAWISGTYQLLLDPDDPWPEGYRLSDTWGVRSEQNDLQLNFKRIYKFSEISALFEFLGETF